ncbi:hypothetical protein DPMN_117405 [Dreissena polymorpha]|uniref:Uncharacterized protein n=1 Tax=Dreissena polymorpha TaxID=45954 RepID=A0A9D4QV62_DREPO|nr:hypothetical protein DPMN_117405 [Dreissena polymorpha]
MIGILYSGEIRTRLHLDIYNSILQLHDWDTLQWGNQNQAPTGNIQLHITAAGLGYFTVRKSGSDSTWKYTTPYYSCHISNNTTSSQNSSVEMKHIILPY